VVLRRPLGSLLAKKVAPTDVGDRATVPPDKTIEAHYNMATTLQAAQRLIESLEATMRDLGLR
jgi:hypothetical protein